MPVVDFARRLGHNALRAARQTAGRLALPRGAGFWVRVRLAPPLDEQRPPAMPFQREAPLSLLDVLEILEAAAQDPQVDGVLLRLDGAPHGWAKVLSLRRAVERVREAGKPVAAWGERLGAEDLLLGSAATRLWLPPSGSVALVGLRAESVFVRGLLARLGVEADVVRVGGYKAAGEMLVRDSLSPEAREQTEALLDDLYGELVDGIARGRGLDPQAVRERIDAGPYTAPAAAEAGLIDGCLYPDELEEALERLASPPPEDRPGPRRVRVVDAPFYGALRARDAGWRPLVGDLPKVAYVVATGAIHRGRGFSGIGSDGLRGLLEKLARDPAVRGVVLRITSPGGDGLASDLLWRAVRVARRDKPVVVSMGDVAASGGYYVAAAADAVLAEAGTLTGSIGVVGGKLHAEELLERIGVTTEAVERGSRAGLLAATRGFTPDERALVRREMEALYTTFLDRVAEGRAMSRRSVEKLAGGRVWSGLRARELGLIDALGGPLEALAETRRRAGIGEDERVLLEIHPRRPRFGGLRWLLGLGSERAG
ncbi:MAG: signal peptide peptidase SppA [Deltaproteobacteria bacterium]|nr:signal peptide peptidase SppA [Deltaproteobacteria bacterium]